LVIIGLSGYAQAGKDTVAKYLIEEHGFERIAFADTIRDILWEMNPLLGDDLHLQTVIDDYGWDVAKTKFPEVRRLLQEIGVSARKYLDENIWIAAALRKIDSEGNYVITDVRFANEAVMVRQLGGRVWRVERPGVYAVNNHVSENDLVGWKFDAYLLNFGTIEELNESVKACLELV